MHPRLRFWLIVILGILAAVVAAYEIAQESFGLAGLLLGGVVWLLLEWRRQAWPEAWAVAAVLVGYIVANRGFAQLSLARQLPMLPAEAALGVALAGIGFRMVLKQSAAGLRDTLNFGVAFWMLLGAARLWFDFRDYGFIALRDFATIYYALFFFIGQALAAHPPSAALLRRALVVAIVVLPLLFFAYTRFGGFFLQQLTVRGVPLVFYKDDLVAAYCMVAVFVLMTLPQWPVLVRGGLALAAYATAFSINSSRAAIVGLLVTTGWWAAARRWAPMKLQAAAIPVGLAVLALSALVDEKDFRESRLFTLYEHVASMVDIEGSRSYASEDRRHVGDNNRFRLVWWSAIVAETRDQGPLFGLGFGADLTERFIRTYDLDLGDEFTARSPHSIVFTVLARMGLVGLSVFLVIVAAMGWRTLQLVRLARTDDQALLPLGWWSVCWVLFTSACFGVVLEGPMGAVVFWTALGLANVTTLQLLGAVQPGAPAAALSTSPSAPLGPPRIASAR